MSILTYPFWNRAERRLRAFWRLLLYLVVFGLLAVVFSLPQVLFAGPEILTVLPPWFLAVGTLATLAATVVSLWFAARFIDRRRLRVGYGLQLDRRWWADFAFGSALGVVLQAAIFGVSLGLGWIAVRGTFYVSGEGAFAGAILAFAVLFFCVGIYEELISRGYLMRNVAEGLSFLDRRVAVVLAWLFSSAIFGVLHATNPNASLVSTINLVLAGLLLGLPVLLSGRLGAPIGLHITWNFTMGNVFGFPVSGNPTSATFIAVAEQGPDLWTGGSFGPEAGLIGVLAMLAGAGLIVAWTYRRERRVTIYAEYAVYQPRTPNDAATVSEEAATPSSHAR